MTPRARWRQGLAAALLVGAAAGPGWADTREIDPRHVDAAIVALRGARQRILQHDVERQKRLAILRAQRVEALRLNQRPRADALALQMQMLLQQRRLQAAQDREQLRSSQTALRDALRGTSVP